MRNFKKDRRGVVTVMVTLLLIPAVLLSGTAVDIARIYTARSIMQDANQLAANSVLTQYDALLKDLYGMYGVAKDDPVLGRLVDDYIKAAVFGDDAMPIHDNTLKPFYGADGDNISVTVDKSKSLGEPEVLRHQIEEYMKIRGPVLIVKEIIDQVSGGSPIQEDIDVLEEKSGIDQDIADLCEDYKELYALIQAADNCKQGIGMKGGVGNVAGSLKAIRNKFKDLENCYKEWENETDPNKKHDLEIKYNGIRKHIEALTTEGYGYSTWKPGGFETVGGEQVWKDGEWRSPYPIVGLNSNIEKAKRDAEDFKPTIDAVVAKAQEIDNKQQTLQRRINNFDDKLRRGECSPDITNAMTEPNISVDGEMISQIDLMRRLTATRWQPAADSYKTKAYYYIDETVKKQSLDKVEYPDSNRSPSDRLTRPQLAAISSNPAFDLSESTAAEDSRAAFFAGFTDVTYGMPGGFEKFKDDHTENYAYLEGIKNGITNADVTDMTSDTGESKGNSSNAEDDQEDNIFDIINKAVEVWKTALTNSPEGALYINDSSASEREDLNFLEAVALIAESLKNNIVGAFTDPLGALATAGDYTLVLTYDLAMFSNYTTAKPGGETVRSVTNIEMSPKINYFYQSEWEYLFNEKQSAAANLDAVTQLLLIVRIVCNYITVFSVHEITAIVSAIQGAFAWLPPVGLALGELARAAFVIAESIVDIAVLRSGNVVPLVKTAGEWICKPSGILNVLKKASEGGAETLALFDHGLSYSNYMLLMFIGQAVFMSGTVDNAANTLAKRTGDLIKWNVNSCIFGIGEKAQNERPGAMSDAQGKANYFKLEERYTTFTLTTTSEMRMMFLSMPFAQKGINGVVPPKTLQLKVSDQRGY
jgi:hypothetical protein